MLYRNIATVQAESHIGLEVTNELGLQLSRKENAITTRKLQGAYNLPKTVL